MTTIRSVVTCVLSLLLAWTTNAAIVSTGDLGPNVVAAGGAYEWSPAVSSPSNNLPATLTVTCGLWNDPDVLVHAYVNGTEVGSFTVHDGYFFPGPSSNSFSIAGLLVDGANTVRFDGLGASPGDYVIGCIELNYNVPLPPADPPVTEPPPTNGPVNGPFIRNGSSVLHYTTRTPLAPTDAGSNVSAAVKLDLKEQGNSARQKFDFTATGLAPNATYSLLAARGDEMDASAIGTFLTDKRGRAHVSFTKQANEHAKIKTLFAPDLFPVTNIRAIGIQNAAAQTLALAWIDASPSFQYLVKRNLTPSDPNGTAAGWISLKATAQEVSFRLLAGGLIPGATYHLALNSNVVDALTADAGGALQVNAWPASAPAVLDVRVIALTDGSGNSVLSTPLPK